MALSTGSCVVNVSNISCECPIPLLVSQIDTGGRGGGVSTLKESLLTPLCHFLPPTKCMQALPENTPNTVKPLRKDAPLMHECSLHTERACQKGFHCLRSIDTLRQIGLGVDGNLIPRKCFWFGGNIDENDVLVDKSRK